MQAATPTWSQKQPWGTTMNDARVCAGGSCAAICPVYNPGGPCPTPAELAQMYREGLVPAVDALVH
jgi:hypothetical protein